MAAANEMIESPFGPCLRSLWLLDPEVHFLNHGSFGATPISVLAAQDEWRRTMERQPVRFMLDELPGTIRAAAERLGAELGAAGEQIALAFNATEAINGVLGSIAWRPGDEVVVADHAYPAIRNAVHRTAQRHGLRVVDARIPFPIEAPETIVAAYRDALSPRSRLLIVDHVFSALAIIAPVDEIVLLCRERKVQVLVDGAHAPGVLDLDLTRLGADWYIGNAHKWMFAAKGSAFLYAAPGADAGLHPAVISNQDAEGFPRAFDWTGTRDYSAWLALPSALEFLRKLGPAAYRRHLFAQAREVAAMLGDRWKTSLPAPPEMCGAMVTVALPGPLARAGLASADDARRLRRRLLDDFRIEVPPVAIGGRLWIRVSAQVYNALDDYAALGAAIERLATQGV